VDEGGIWTFGLQNAISSAAGRRTELIAPTSSQAGSGNARPDQ
jgi:hypothetical protein